MYEIFDELMKEKGLKFSQIARDTGISYSTFTDWKAGRCSPKYEKLKKIADYFGVSVDYLLGVQTSGQEGYYTNPETAKIAQEIFDDPDLRILFDAARDCRPEDLKMAAEMLKRFKGED